MKTRIAAAAIFVVTMAAACAHAPKQAAAPAVPPEPRGYHHLQDASRMLYLPNLGRLYPKIQLRFRVEGKVVLHCVLQPDEQLHDCRIVSEEPPNQGFGAASLEAAQIYRVRPLVRNGRPLKRELIELPFSWVPRN